MTGPEDPPNEVLVTPEMIAAGVEAFSYLAVGSSPSDAVQEVVETVFLEMWKARALAS